MSKRSTTKRAFRYWGYIPFAIAIFGWLTPDLSPYVIILMSGLATFYFFFQVPVPCGAETRTLKGGCRNNGSGLLLGCHLQYHKMDKLKKLFSVHRFGEFFGSLWSNSRRACIAIAEIVTVASLCVALVDLIFK